HESGASFERGKECPSRGYLFIGPRLGRNRWRINSPAAETRCKEHALSRNQSASGFALHALKWISDHRQTVDPVVAGSSPVGLAFKNPAFSEWMRGFFVRGRQWRERYRVVAQATIELNLYVQSFVVSSAFYPCGLPCTYLLHSPNETTRSCIA